MKKMFWMLGVAVAAMTSCTSDEVLEMNPTNAIKFESFVNKGTRALENVVNTSGTQVGLQKFFVFGTHGTNDDFTNTPVTYNGSGWGYTGGDRYWVVDTYKFGAYATTNNDQSPLTNPNNVSFTGGVLQFGNFEITDGKDLVAALKTVTIVDLSNAPSEVDLQFEHMLARVKFTFRNTHELDGTTMDITDFKITNLPKVGTCTYGGNPIVVWDPNDEASNYITRTLDPQSNIAKNSAFTDELFVMPEVIRDNILVSFNVTYKNSSSETIGQKSYENIKLKSETIDNNTWVNGLVYNYTADLPFSPNKIVFNATVTPWDDEIVVPDKDNTENVGF